MQLWTVIERIMAKKVMKMLRKKVRYQKNDKNIARNILSAEKGGECWHCHKKNYNKEDC
jgi:hypothetical protein